MIGLWGLAQATQPSAVALSADGAFAIVGTEDGTRTVWWPDGRPPLVAGTAELPDPGHFSLGYPWETVRALVVSGDGSTAASTHEAGVVAIFDPRTGRAGPVVRLFAGGPITVPWTKLRVPPGQPTPMVCGNGGMTFRPPALSDDGRRLLTVGGHDEDTRIALWDATNGALLRVWTSDESAWWLGFDPAGDPVVLVGSALVVLGEVPRFVVVGVEWARPERGGQVAITGPGGFGRVDLATGAVTAATPPPREEDEEDLTTRSADGAVRVWVGSDGAPRFQRGSSAAP